MRLIGIGEANVLIVVSPGTRVSGLAGSRVVEQVVLGVADPAGLTAQIRALRRNDRGDVCIWPYADIG